MKENFGAKVNFDVNAFKTDLDLSAFNHVLVITGTQNSLRAFETKVRPVLEAKKVNFKVFTNISANLTEHEVYSVVNYVKGDEIDCILSVGADAVMDCGRLVSLLLSHGGFLHDYLPGGSVGPAGITEKVIHHKTVPTMPAAGSEISNQSTVRIGGQSVIIASPFLIPDEAFVDPKLMTDMPGDLWAIRGFDGFATALGAYVSEKANEFSDTYALPALQSYIGHARYLVKDPNNLGNIRHACVVSMNAFLAASYSGTGLYCIIANSLVSRLGIRRGVAQALICPQTSAHLYEKNPARFDEVAKMLGGKDIKDAITKLVKSLGIQLPDTIFGDKDVKAVLRGT